MQRLDKEVATTRLMARADTGRVAEVIKAATEDLISRAGITWPAPTAGHEERMLATLARFVDTDGPGCWVAEQRGEVVGIAVAIHRDSFWGLALLFVHPQCQTRGVGSELLRLAQTHGAESRVGMILSSVDFRAIRAYAKAGFEIHPAMMIQGEVDRASLPHELSTREGSLNDLELADRVDRAVAGNSRIADVEFLLRQGARMAVIDRRGREGFAVFRDGRAGVDISPMMLAAADETTGRELLWHVFAETQAPIFALGWTHQQRWAIDLAIAARLRVTPGNPMFVRGLPKLPLAWLPHPFYF